MFAEFLGVKLEATGRPREDVERILRRAKLQGFQDIGDYIERLEQRAQDLSVKVRRIAHELALIKQANDRIVSENAELQRANAVLVAAEQAANERLRQAPSSAKPIKSKITKGGWFDFGRRASGLPSQHLQ